MKSNQLNQIVKISDNHSRSNMEFRSSFIIIIFESFLYGSEFTKV